ncbi:DUF1349 domain-containing protein [Endozoicomonas arenosclerae]|uniref:DUF1349 domain-containing protein n=1 Tax=Endozoicomonas arenosclerae TaxID=1633495 RepID=UPI0009A2288B|nr:DUF1349 domain-containing protein [Endozoicomonas arenosclerae]
MIDFTKGAWIFEPKRHDVSNRKVVITTEPETDFWQRSYYGFRNDNAPSLLVESSDNFTFTTMVEFEYKSQFDQCGLISTGHIPRSLLRFCGISRSMNL